MGSKTDEKTPELAEVETMKSKLKTIDDLFMVSKIPLPNIKVETLNETNFKDWSEDIIAKLEFYGLELLLEKMPTEMLTNDLFMRYNKMVMSIIKQNTEPKLRHLVQDEQTAHKRYARLSEICEGSEQLQFIKAFAGVQRLMEAKEENLEKVIAMIKEVIHRFQLAKMSGNEDLIWIAVLINSLPEKMSHLKSKLCSMNSNKIDEYFQIVLKEKHMIMKQSSESNVRPMSNNINRPPVFYNKKFENGCFECGSEEHRRRDCPQYRERMNKLYSNPNANGRRNQHTYRPNGNNNYARQQRNNCIANDNGDEPNEETNAQQVTSETNRPLNNTVSRRLMNCSIISNLRNKSKKIYLDSGATDDMMNDETECFEINECNSSIYTASGDPVPILGVGKRLIETNMNYKFEMNECIICPQLSANFISVPKLDERGFTVVFGSQRAQIFLNKRLVMIAVLRSNGLYEVLLKEEVNQVVHSKQSDDLILF